MTRIYIAGPMTGLPNLNFPAFIEAAAHLRRKGYEVVSPAELDLGPNPSWETCLKACLREVVTCDLVALLPAWENSRGARLEHHVATELKIPTFNAFDTPPLPPT